MSWRVVVINEHSKLSYQNNAMIFKTADITEKIHLSEIHTVMIETTDVVITTALVAKMIDNKIKLIFCDDKRLPTAELVPYYGCHDTSRSVLHQIHWDENVQKVVWTEIIRQKIYNQAAHLLYRGKKEEYFMLKEYLSKLELYDMTNREGHAAKVYFNSLFGKEFTRDDENDTNAALNYGYTLLLSVFSREVVKNGYITQLGLKHSNYFNAFNLVSDLMEPFRILVDEIVYDNHEFDFKKIKYQLFTLFNNTYSYEGKEMYLVNIIEIYVKKTLLSLTDEKARVPLFEFVWEKGK